MSFFTLLFIFGLDEKYWINILCPGVRAFFENMSKRIYIYKYFVTTGGDQKSTRINAWFYKLQMIRHEYNNYIQLKLSLWLAAGQQDRYLIDLIQSICSKSWSCLGISGCRKPPYSFWIGHYRIPYILLHQTDDASLKLNKNKHSI